MNDSFKVTCNYIGKFIMLHAKEVHDTPLCDTPSAFTGECIQIDFNHLQM